MSKRVAAVSSLAMVSAFAARPAAEPTDDFAARYIATHKKGYHARPCGLDANRNGVVGEPADRRLGDGRTADPDGDGVKEDVVYVDAAEGTTGRATDRQEGPSRASRRRSQHSTAPTTARKTLSAFRARFTKRTPSPTAGSPVSTNAMVSSSPGIH